MRNLDWRTFPSVFRLTFTRPNQAKRHTKTLVAKDLDQAVDKIGVHQHLVGPVLQRCKGIRKHGEARCDQFTRDEYCARHEHQRDWVHAPEPVPQQRML